ncbi:MAG: NusG domain II-containing protein [Oscillospiraceae bacterium]|nr:NusG domain II-containing protein [Oscillospiraceae bacterium]
MKQAKYRTFRAADAVLIAGLLVFAGAFWFFSGNFAGAAGGTVTVRRGGAVYATLPLGAEATVDVTLPDGTVTNTVRISGGEAYMEYANCPDGLCLRHGALRGGRDIIVCLPNSVTVEASAAGGIDAVSK